MFKRIVGARNISVDDVPTYMDELDELEAGYFSKERDPNAMKDARLRGLYEYTMLTQVPPRPDVHVPYRQIADLALVAPEGAVEEFVTKRLIANGAAKEASPELATRIAWAARWARDADLRVDKASAEEGPAVLEVTQERDEKTTAALRAFSEALAGAKTTDEIQGAAFEAIRSSGAEPGKFFSAIYRILLGTERGPRLGPYIIDAGREAVTQKITGVLDAKSQDK